MQEERALLVIEAVREVVVDVAVLLGGAGGFELEQLDVLVQAALEEFDRAHHLRFDGVVGPLPGLAHGRLRTEVEIALGGDFNQRRFHDFILEQGLLPPDLLREAVLDEFVR